MRKKAGQSGYTDRHSHTDVNQSVWRINGVRRIEKKGGGKGILREQKSYYKARKLLSTSQI